MNVVGKWLQDPRLKSLDCDDLLSLKRREVALELLISSPWLIVELYLLAAGYHIPAMLAAFFFFLTGLRQVHQGYHLALGIPRLATDMFLFVLSLLMLGSMHAVKYNHLMHHRHCLDDADIEAKSAKMTWYGAILFGPVFPVLLHRNALKNGSRYYRAWIVAELLGNAVMIGAAFLHPVIAAHVILMAAGQCLTAFFAVWTVHHDCDGDVFARTQRGFLKNFISYDMFYHVEHHLFPRVPQKRLPEVARRIDVVVPELTGKAVY